VPKNSATFAAALRSGEFSSPTQNECSCGNQLMCSNEFFCLIIREATEATNEESSPPKMKNK
jgi:hypothetical protein